MLFFTYLLSPSLDIIVKVAPSSAHLAEGLLHMKRWIGVWWDAVWPYISCEGLIRKRGTQLSHGVSNVLILFWFHTSLVFPSCLVKNTETPKSLIQHLCLWKKFHGGKIWLWKFFVFDPSAVCTTQNRAIFGFTASRGSASSHTVH